MKEIKLQNNTYLFLDVPEDAYDFNWNCLYDWRNFHLTYFIKDQPRIYSNKTYNYPDSKIPYFAHKARYNLPEIISTTKDITEEQAETIVEKVMNGQHYQNYNYKSVVDRWVKTAKESLQSLIQANGLDIDKNYLILAKQ